MADGPRIYFSDDQCRVTLWEDLAIIDIPGTLDEQHMVQLEAAFLLLRRERSHEIGVLALLRASAPIPLAVARQHAIRILKAYDWIAQVAVVFEGTGVTTQMLRTVVRSIKMLAGASRLALVDSLDEAEALLFTRVFQQTGALTLVQLKRVLRSALSDYTPNASARVSRG
jgi:hypothetical protein